MLSYKRSGEYEYATVGLGENITQLERLGEYQYSATGSWVSTSSQLEGLGEYQQC